MALCSHCGYAVSPSESRITCANCGRKKVKPSKRKPVSITTVSACQERYGKNAAHPATTALMAVIFLGATVLFLYLGFWVRGVVGFFFDLFGILCGVATIQSFSGWMRALFTDRSPQKAYLDHLQDLRREQAGLAQRAGHPGRLEYDARSIEGTSIRFPHLLIRRRAEEASA